MKKKFIALFLVLSLFTVTASFIIPMNTYAENTENKYNRVLANYDFEDNVEGKAPYKVAIYADSPASGLVREVKGNKLVALSVPRVLGKTTGSAIVCDKNFSGETKISIDFYVSNVKIQNQIMFKDLATGKFISLLFWSGSEMKCLNKVVDTSVFEGLVDNTWYSFDMIMNSEENTASITLKYNDNGEEKEAEICNDTSLLISESEINYQKLSFRVQAQNYNNEDSVTYVDNLNIKTSGYPNIELRGDDTVYITEGSAYDEPGYTAEDIVDGVITDKVITNSNVNTAVAGKYIISYDVTSEDGTVAETKYRTVIVKERKMLSDALLSTENNTAGNEITNIADGDTSTSWRPGNDKTQAYFTAEFNKKVLLDRFVIESENDNIKKCLLTYSPDNVKWINIPITESVENLVKTYTFTPIEAMSIKFTIVEADNSDGIGISITEAEGYVSDESIVSVDASKQAIDTREEITQSLVLPTKGEYGSSITWKSDKPEVIMDDGTVIRPEEDTLVTLTANVSYKTAEKSIVFENLSVRHKESEFGRKLAHYDFEDNTVGKAPYGFAIYAEAPASGLVEQLDDNKAVALRVPYAAGKSTGSCIVLDRGYSGKVEISMKFMCNDATTQNQIMFKNLTSGIFTPLIYIVGNGTTQCLKKTISADIFTFAANIWYTFDMVMDTTDNTATIKMLYTDESGYHEALICEKESILVNESTIDYNKLSFRLQAQNSKSPDKATYVDNIDVRCSGYPEISLLGDETIYMTEGTEYKEPGYTANDIIDGDIKENVITSTDLNTNVPGTYTIKYTVSSADGTKATPRYRTVIVKRHNLLSMSSVSSSDETDGYTVKNIVDGDYETQWRAGADKTSAAFTAAFDEICVVDEMIITSYNDNIKDYTVSYADSNLSWKTIATQTTNDGYKTTLNFSPVEAKQIRFTINDAAITDGVGISLCEAECYTSDESVAKTEASKITLNTSQKITSDIVLRTKGVYGAVIEWSSSNTDVIKNNGSVTRPTNDTNVTLKATVKYKTAEIPVTFPTLTVKAKDVINNAGGGGGGNASGGRTTGGLTSIPPQNAIADNTDNDDTDNDFNDVSSSHWAYKYINTLVNHGKIDGVGNNMFAPEIAVTREAFIKLLVSCFELNNGTGECNFKDVDRNEWYYNYVAVAYEKGLVNGISENSFGIGQSITRQDMAVILSRTMEILDISIDEQTSEVSFNDGENISDYARADVERLVKCKILNGDDDGAFNPHGELTRAQAAKVLCMVVYGG